MSLISGGNVIEGTLGPHQVAGTPTNGTSETQTVAVTPDDSLGGTFRLKFEGFETADLADDASTAAVQAALRLLPSIGSGGCSVSGSPGSYTVAFSGDLGKKNVSLLESTEEVTCAVVIAVGTPGVDATARLAATGCELIDTTNGVLYINTGTPVAPTWTKVGTQS